MQARAFGLRVLKYQRNLQQCSIGSVKKAKMKFELSEPLPTAVHSNFVDARAKESLIFSHTELTTIRTSSGIPVSKYSSSL